jgi:hypothetical protein
MTVSIMIEPRGLSRMIEPQAGAAAAGTKNRPAARPAEILAHLAASGHRRKSGHQRIALWRFARQ